MLCSSSVRVVGWVHYNPPVSNPLCGSQENLRQFRKSFSGPLESRLVAPHKKSISKNLTPNLNIWGESRDPISGVWAEIWQCPVFECLRWDFGHFSLFKQNPPFGGWHLTDIGCFESKERQMTPVRGGGATKPMVTTMGGNSHEKKTDFKDELNWYHCSGRNEIFTKVTNCTCSNLFKSFNL